MQPENQTAFAVWLTGLPASGKSTVAAALAKKLAGLGMDFTVLESDVLRKLIPTSAAYDERDREYFYSSLAFIGQVLTQHGISVIFDATANRRSYRDRARQQIARFVEVFVECSLDVCIERDPKGIYRMAREGKAGYVPGLQEPYEPPESPDLVIHGDKDDPEDGAARIVECLTRKHFLPLRHRNDDIT
jgi:adenylylsulfate kinase